MDNPAGTGTSAAFDSLRHVKVLKQEEAHLAPQYKRHVVLDGKHDREIILDATVSAARWQFQGLTAEQYDRIFGVKNG